MSPELTQLDALHIALQAAFGGGDHLWFTPEAAAELAGSAKVDVFNQEANWVNLEFEAGDQGLLMAELVHEKGAWMTFFDGAGPNDEYCEPDPDKDDGSYRIVRLD
jgi:hypothetical protein